MEMSQKRIEADDFKARHRQTDTAFTRVRQFAIRISLGIDLKKKREIITKRVERSDGLAGASTGDRQCVFADKVQAKTYGIYRTQSSDRCRHPV